ncbi:MAG: hypothetical protein V3R28_02640 [Desulfatiglandales bacterium]
MYLFSACSSSLNIYDRLSDTEYTSSDYRVVLERWTRKRSIHRGLKTELLVMATYKTEEFSISHWSSIYIFRFKKEDQDQPSKSVELIFTSAPGSATLKWEL